MNPDELNHIIDQPEGLKIEFKRHLYKITDSDYSLMTPQQKRKELKLLQWGEFLKDILSIANGNVNATSQNGYLIIGVEDATKEKYDVGQIDETSLRKQIIQRLTDIANPPLADIHCNLIELEGKRLLLITIPPSPHLHETIKDLQTPKRIYPKHTVFVRRGEEIEPASNAERKAILAEKERLLYTLNNPITQGSIDVHNHFDQGCNLPTVGRYTGENSRLLVAVPQKERFAKSITAWMDRLKRRVEWLTDDQCQVLHQFRYRHRALVTGCAGSGKTLLAAEKAIRLDAAGVRTLVLCHNPNLARYIASLIANPAIDVYDFTTFVNKLNGISIAEHAGWTAFEEPLGEDLDRAFDAVNETTAVYEAIIVDEGQDFRDEWWVLVDAILHHSTSKTLYIFCDDNQALLPHRAHYPVDCQPVSMSRNCRNAGNIFEIVRRFHRDAPLTSNFLADDGIAKVSLFDEQDFRIRLEEALLDAYNYVNHTQIRLLTNEASAETSKINGFEFIRQTEYRWRIVISKHLYAMREKALRRVVRLRSGNSSSEIANRFGIPQGQLPEDYLSVPLLSQEKVPSPQDVRSVQVFASKLVPFFGGRINNTVRFAIRNRELYLTANTHTGKETTVNDASKTYFYSLPIWASSLRVGRATRVVANWNFGVTDDIIPLYAIDAFKGLECDALVLVVNSTSHNLLREMYVGSSRAVCYLNVVISRSVFSKLTSLADLDVRFMS
jgi:hypothetical protein